MRLLHDFVHLSNATAAINVDRPDRNVGHIPGVNQGKSESINMARGGHYLTGKVLVF